MFFRKNAPRFFELQTFQKLGGFPNLGYHQGFEDLTFITIPRPLDNFSLPPWNP